MASRKGKELPEVAPMDEAANRARLIAVDFGISSLGKPTTRMEEGSNPSHSRH